MITKSLQTNVDELLYAAQKIRDQIEAAGNDALASHRPVDDYGDLPLPRLEMEWTASDDPNWDWEVEYRLVYAHFLGHSQCVRMGLTRVGNGNRRPDFAAMMKGAYDGLPFRDGAHFTHDAGHFNMPMYVVTPDGTAEIDGNLDTKMKGRDARRARSMR